MIKKRKKTGYQKKIAGELHIGHDTDIKIKPSNKMGVSDEEHDLSKYIGIEKHLSLDTFYSLSGSITDSGYKNDKVTVGLSGHHHVTVSNLSTYGIIRGNLSDSLRGLFCNGILTLMRHEGLCLDEVDNTIKQLTTQAGRIDINYNRLDESLDRMDLKGSERDQKALRKIIISCGNNIYGTHALGVLEKATQTKERQLKYKTKKNIMVADMVSRFELITKDPLNSSMFFLSDDKKNPESMSFRVSRRFLDLLNEYKKTFHSGGCYSEVVRACIITGLYCLAKWVLDGRTNKDEIEFYVLIDKIDRYNRIHY